MCTAMEIFKRETLEKGEGIGFEKGKQFGISMIINMFNNGMSIEEIAKCTNLDEEEISYYLSLESQKLIN